MVSPSPKWILLGLALLGSTLLLVCGATLQAGGKKSVKSDAEVKVSATAGKAGADGKQPVTITLAVNKGWHIYANPVGEETLAPVQTVVTVAGKEKPQDVKIEYPAGKVKEDKDLKITYKIYEDKVDIKAHVHRAKGDTGPLEVSVKLQTCSDKSCLLPATVKVPVK